MRSRRLNFVVVCVSCLDWDVVEEVWGTTDGVCDPKGVEGVAWIVAGFEFEDIGSWIPLFVAADVVVLSVVPKLSWEEFVDVDVGTAGWVAKSEGEDAEDKRRLACVETDVRVFVVTVVVIRDSVVSSADVTIVEFRACEFLVIVSDVCVRELEGVTEGVVPAEGVDEDIVETDFGISRTFVFVVKVAVWNVDDLLSIVGNFAEELVRSLEDMVDRAFVMLGWVDKDGNTSCRLVGVTKGAEDVWDREVMVHDLTVGDGDVVNVEEAEVDVNRLVWIVSPLVCVRDIVLSRLCPEIITNDVGSSKALDDVWANGLVNGNAVMTGEVVKWGNEDKITGCRLVGVAKGGENILERDVMVDDLTVGDGDVVIAEEKIK